MNYEEAKKAVDLTVKTGYMIIPLGYFTAVLPHAEGIKLLESLKSAEQADSDYGTKTISPMQQDSISVKLLSHAQYQRIKISMLLGVTVDEVKAMEEANKPTRKRNDEPY